MTASRAGGGLEIGEHQVSGSDERIAKDGRRKLGCGKERVDTLDEQGLGFVDVADPASDVLGEQKLPDRPMALVGCTSGDLVEVGGGSQQVGPQALQLAMGSELERRQQLDHRCVEASDGVPGSLESDPQLSGWPTPTLPTPIDVPGAGHAHVGMEVAPVIETDQQMLSAGLDALHRASFDQRRVDAGEVRSNRCDLLRSESSSESAGRSMDRITLGHGPSLSLARPRVRRFVNFHPFHSQRGGE